MPMRSSILRLQCYRVPGDQDVSCVPAVRTALTESNWVQGEQGGQRLLYILTRQRLALNTQVARCAAKLQRCCATTCCSTFLCGRTRRTRSLGRAWRSLTLVMRQWQVLPPPLGLLLMVSRQAAS